MNDKLMKKLVALKGSLKFALVTVIYLSSVVEGLVAGSMTLPLIVDLTQTWIAAVTGIGIIDGIAERLGGKKKAGEDIK